LGTRAPVKGSFERSEENPFTVPQHASISLSEFPRQQNPNDEALKDMTTSNQYARIK